MPAEKRKASPLDELFARLDQIEGWPGKSGEIAPVVPAAQSFVLAAALRCLSDELAGRTAWILCPGLRFQERMFSELRSLGFAPEFYPARETGAQTGDGETTGVADPDGEAERVAILLALSAAGPSPGLIVAQAASLDDPAPALLEGRTGGSPQKAVTLLQAGEARSLPGFLEELKRGGWREAARVSGRGEYAVRGNLVDVFSWNHADPIRLEWEDGRLASIRDFDLDSQRSFAGKPEAVLLKDVRFPKGEGETDLRAFLESRLPAPVVFFSLDGGEDRGGRRTSLCV